LVQKLGHNVIAKVGSGKEAIEKAEELNPDLIIMDIILKGEMDGIEAMEEIRKKSSVPVVYLSGNSDRFNYERAKKTGFADYLVKPITSNDLKRPLHKVFGNGMARSVAFDEQAPLNKTA
jgi:CheY-like chemotaxis protein